MRAKCQSPAHFFKIIRPGSLFQQSIPKSFRKYLNGRRNNKTAILKRGSKKWSVKVTDWVFSDGWENFVRENSVQECDIVVFKHEGNMVFDTIVFDTPSWSERECSDNQIAESSKKPVKKIPKKKDTITDQIHHPFFIGTISGVDHPYKLYLPFDFARSNGLSTGAMIIRNGQSQKSWTVEIKIRANGYSYIGPGWIKFYTENGLKEGDQFKLELIQTGAKPVAVFYKLGTNQSESHGMAETPHFVRTVKISSDSRYRIYVPKKFASENGLASGELILKNAETEGSWTVTLCNHKDKFCCIHSGLEEFCIANGFKVGDHIKFELIQSGQKLILSTSIYRNEVASVESLRAACSSVKLP